MSSTPEQSCIDGTMERLLPDYAIGRLTELENQMVRSHLDACEACRRSLSIMRIITMWRVSDQADDRPGADKSVHPTARQIGAYYCGSDALDEKERLTIESHLRTCADCAREIEFLTSLETDLRTIPPDGTYKKEPVLNPLWRRSLFNIPVPAYMVAALVLITAVSGVMWSSWQNKNMFSTGNAALHEQQRGSAEPALIVRQVDRFLVRANVPVFHNTTLYRYNLTVTSANDEPTKSPVSADFEISHIINLIIDTKGVPDGEYDLVIVEIGLSDSSRTEYHFPFILKTAN